jgi:hypothetical protein
MRGSYIAICAVGGRPTCDLFHIVKTVVRMGGFLSLRMVCVAKDRLLLFHKLYVMSLMPKHITPRQPPAIVFLHVPSISFIVVCSDHVMNTY